MRLPDKIYWPNGNLRCELYFSNEGSYHRDDGPAVIHYYEDGSPNYNETRWVVNGTYLSKYDFLKAGYEAIEKLKAYPLFTPMELIKLQLDR